MALSPIKTMKLKNSQTAKVKQKNPVGRPLVHTVEEVEAKIKAYFDNQDSSERPYTVTGLARALGMDRDQLINYGSKEQFANAIKEAKMKVHEYAEERLFGNSATGVIFNLKNNWGWKDKTEREVSGSLGVNVIDKDQAKRIAQEVLNG